MRDSGFTLIELIIAVAIVAILAAIALPSYQQYVIRGRRAAVEGLMMDMANRQQQYFLANRSYYSVTAASFGLSSDLSPYYDCTATPGTDVVPSFAVSCAPKGAQAGDGTLNITNTGAKTPVGKW